MTVRVGISGWTYAGWRGGAFYPAGLPHRAELAYVAERLDTVEVNGSFYALQRPDSYRAWAAATPPGFVFAVKGGRFITHLKKLRDVEVPLANFLASGVLALGPKLGPLLWQLPPQLPFDPARIADFLALLPRTVEDAARVAARHDARMEGRAFTTPDPCEADRPLRHAMEVRHETYRDDRFLALLAAHGVAAVTADTAGRWPLLLEQTADFGYVRLHGDEELYVSGYDDASLDRWAERIRGWATGPDGPRDVVAYFDNDVKVRAPVDAMALAARLRDLGPAGPGRGGAAPPGALPPR